MKTAALVMTGITLAILTAGPSRANKPPPGPAGIENTGPKLEGAWAAWQNGDIAIAQQMAAKLAGSAKSRHLQFLCAMVNGRYEAALDHYTKINPSYEKLSELDKPLVDTYLHLARYEDAARFARQRNMDKKLIATLDLRAQHPFRVSLETLTVVPFAKTFLTPYFPAFVSELEGQETTVHVDTGGTYLHMGPHRAEKLGIEFIDAGTGFHGPKKINISMGIAKKFTLGDVVFENVPVAVMPSLRGTQDFVIFGTSILQPFHATLDYPDGRLILSPRENEELRKKHMAMLPAKRVEMPFYMWSDHYMFARGGFGRHKNLNFFIDSGLVSIAPDGKGGLRQACFLATPELYKQWGIEPGRAQQTRFESSLPISLGSLEQARPFVEVQKNPSWTSFGGVRIDGLLSHAFLSRYAWTLDFQRRRYIFSAKPEGKRV